MDCGRGAESCLVYWYKSDTSQRPVRRFISAASASSVIGGVCGNSGVPLDRGCHARSQAYDARAMTAFRPRLPPAPCVRVQSPSNAHGAAPHPVRRTGAGRVRRSRQAVAVHPPGWKAGCRSDKHPAPSPSRSEAVLRGPEHGGFASYPRCARRLRLAGTPAGVSATERHQYRPGSGIRGRTGAKIFCCV